MFLFLKATKNLTSYGCGTQVDQAFRYWYSVGVREGIKMCLKQDKRSELASAVGAAISL